MEKAEYHKYLASREWAKKKWAVRKRAGGNCERCHKNPIAATHHLTYERVGKELLEDLQGVCSECHAYESAVSDVDPRKQSPLKDIAFYFYWYPGDDFAVEMGSHNAEFAVILWALTIALMDFEENGMTRLDGEEIIRRGYLPYKRNVCPWASMKPSGWHGCLVGHPAHFGKIPFAADQFPHGLITLHCSPEFTNLDDMVKEYTIELLKPRETPMEEVAELYGVGGA